MINEIHVGLEISEDRQHTSVAAAGYLEDDQILVSLETYVAGTDPVAELLKLLSERQVRVIALDPQSPGATLCKLLKDAGISFTELTAHDVAVAHGQFIDRLAAGKLKVARDARLTAAVRHGQDRRLVGASAWERRGAAVDVGPALAAEFAVWSLTSSASFFGVAYR